MVQAAGTGELTQREPEIDGKTVLTGLLGRPVSHSVSPLMHNSAFERLGLNYVYLCFDVGEEELVPAVEGLKALGARGFNCTMPVKNAMAGLCDELRGAASYIGAVNTVVIEDGRLIGRTTDGAGFMRSAAEEGLDLKGKTMTILGGGGAAVAILAQAAIDGVGTVFVFERQGSRFSERLSQIAGKLCRDTGCRIEIHHYSEEAVLERALCESTLLVNATSVGMAPDTGRSLIEDTSLFHPGLAVADVIYHPKKTRLLELAEAAGCRTFNGEGMLLHQGAEAFRLWTGQDMPVEYIRGKLNEAFSSREA